MEYTMNTKNNKKTMIKKTKRKIMKRSEKKLYEWLCHPLEYGKPPVKIEEVFHEKTIWPLKTGKVGFSLVKFHMDEKTTNIGMTGPTTYCLYCNLSNYNMEEIKYIYAGWYFLRISDMLDSINNKDNYKKERQEISEFLLSKRADYKELFELIIIGDLYFYSYKTNDDNIMIYEYADVQWEMNKNSKFKDSPPMFYFVGLLFFQKMI
jgi:hypothetical protein